MNILVCGGAGYIGSHMCQLLASTGHTVTVFDNLSTGHAYAVRWGPLIRGDLLVPGDLARAFSEQAYDAVMHFCAKSLVGESAIYPDLYYRNNVVGTFNLLDAMVRHSIPSLIFSSTAAVFGLPQYTPIDEAHPKQPINCYGRTKLVIENALSDYESASRLRSVSLRYFNAAGADPAGLIGELHEPETHLIPNVLRSLLDGSGRPLQVFGTDYNTPDGTCVRDYIHVSDLCDAHMKALAHLQGGGGSDVFNLGNGQGFSVLDVIKAAEQVTGRQIPYTVADRRIGDPPILVASSTKARDKLGWSPRYTKLSDIIKTAWHWHRRAAFGHTS